MNTNTELAAGTVKTAIERLLWRYPLFAGIVAAWRLQAMTSETVGIGMDSDDFVLYFNPEFVTSIPLEELVGILHHEVRHVVFGHVLLNPDDYDDPRALTVAEEVTCNEDLPEPLPDGAILLKNFPQLKPDEDTNTRYRQLRKRRRKKNKGKEAESQAAEQGADDGTQSKSPAAGKKKETGDGPPDDPAGAQEDQPGQQPSTAGNTGQPTQGGTQGSPNNKGSGSAAPDIPDAVQGDTPSGSGKSGQGSPITKTAGNSTRKGSSALGKTKGTEHGPAAAAAGNKPGQKPSTAGSAVTTIDDHSRWEEIRNQESLARTLISMALREVVSRPDTTLSENEKVLIERAVEGWGLDPGQFFSELDGHHGSAKVAWKHQLRRYVGRELEKSPSYARPPRRFPHLLGVVPGVVQRSARPRIVAIIDTSGSITDGMLAEISSELTYMAKDRDVVVVECDAEIHAVYPYRKPIEKVNGRGGTDFCPPLEPAFLRKIGADLAIYFTDGQGPAPDRRPQVPVVWCLTPGGCRPAAWGKEVKMG